MKIGTLNKDLHGEIATLKMKYRIALIPNKNIKTENSPTHIIIAQNAFNQDIEIGRAWQKNITAGEHVDKNLYNLSMDDMSFEKPLNCTAFPMKDGSYLIDFDRSYELNKKTAA